MSGRTQAMNLTLEEVMVATSSALTKEESELIDKRDEIEDRLNVISRMHDDIDILLEH